MDRQLSIYHTPSLVPGVYNSGNSWNSKLLLEILEISSNLVDAPGKFYNWQCYLCVSRNF